MAFISPCPACLSGNHEGHVEHWGKRPEGIIDGDFCHCPGDCVAQSMPFEEAFAKHRQSRVTTNASEQTDPFAAIAELHIEGDPSGEDVWVCVTCHVLYPCPTATALVALRAACEVREEFGVQFDWATSPTPCMSYPDAVHVKSEGPHPGSIPILSRTVTTLTHSTEWTPVGGEA